MGENSRGKPRCLLLSRPPRNWRMMRTDAFCCQNRRPSSVTKNRLNVRPDGPIASSWHALCCTALSAPCREFQCGAIPVNTKQTQAARIDLHTAQSMIGRPQIRGEREQSLLSSYSKLFHQNQDVVVLRPLAPVLCFMKPRIHMIVN